MAPLAQPSAIVHILETAGGSLRVHPNDKTSFFPALPRDDAAWVVESGADAIVPVPGPGAELLGVLVVGRRLDGRIVRPVDIPFLEALAAAAGLAVARLRLLRVPGAEPLEAPPARECPVCRCVTGPGEPPECGCRAAYVETEVPKLLAGKYQLTQRLGCGGMGMVYLARDLRLERDVAVKTLKGMSVSRLMGLKPEAWVMATVTHPAVTQIHGIESWRGRPFLVVEFLAGGTLADRLRHGPLPAPEAVSVAETLADALAALHETRHLHGDVKPSNVGLTANGSPKLMDFGLARRATDIVTRGGTLSYLSPEVLSGRPAEAADDVWSLCVILYEMVSGEHPFAGNGIDEVVNRIRRQRLARLALSPGAAESRSDVIAFAATMLTAARSVRPATAHAFGAALHRRAASSVPSTHCRPWSDKLAPLKSWMSGRRAVDTVVVQHTVPRSVNPSTRKRVALKPHRAITASRVAPGGGGLGGTRPAKPRSEPRPPSSSARREVDLSTQLPRRGERTPRVPHRLSYRRPPSAARPQGAGVRRAGPGRSSWSPSGGRFDAVVLRGRGRSAVAAAPSAPAPPVWFPRPLASGPSSNRPPSNISSISASSRRVKSANVRTCRNNFLL